MRATPLLFIALLALSSVAQEEGDRSALPPPPIPPEGSEATRAERQARAAQESEAGGTDEGQQQSERQGREQGRRPEPLPPKVEGETVEPEVTIRREGDRRIEEYSIQGRVYMVKIDPDNAPPYYIVDSDGDGVIDLRDDDRLTPVKPAQWKLFEWK